MEEGEEEEYGVAEGQNIDQSIEEVFTPVSSVCQTKHRK